MGLIPVGIPKPYFLQVYPKPTNNGVNPYVTAIVDSDIFKRIKRWIGRMFLLSLMKLGCTSYSVDTMDIKIGVCQHVKNGKYYTDITHQYGYMNLIMKNVTRCGMFNRYGIVND